MWIETLIDSKNKELWDVTPHVGVWIETSQKVDMEMEYVVTPHVGVWIETHDGNYTIGKNRHTSCRCVD